MSNLKTYTKEELGNILNKHLKWINNEEGGEKADLSSANLSFANLRSANLSSADLRYADLSFANLSSANLRSANLRSANLRSANLSSANLSSADLRYANLSSANLRSANLRSANLSSANLRFANLVYFTFNKQTAYFTFDGNIRIGCEYHPIPVWIGSYEALGKKHDYSDLEIMAYKNFIDLCAKLQEEKDKENK